MRSYTPSGRFVIKAHTQDHAVSRRRNNSQRVLVANVNRAPKKAVRQEHRKELDGILMEESDPRMMEGEECNCGECRENRGEFMPDDVPPETPLTTNIP